MSTETLNGSTETEMLIGNSDMSQCQLLPSVIDATRQTNTDQTRALLRNLTGLAQKGAVRFDRNLMLTINQAIVELDEAISHQLNEIVHAPQFTKLEGTWRGLHYLVKNSETNSSLKIRVLNAPKKDIAKDLQKASEFDQSRLFKIVYEEEFGTPGGEPIGVLIGDYEFDHSHEDTQLLGGISAIASASFAPFISAASPRLFGFNDYRDLSRPRDLEKIFASQDYAKWRSLREADDFRFVTLTMPRVLARLPYGSKTVSIEEFAFEEVDDPQNGQLSHEHYCWMNAAYVMGARLTHAYSQTGWCIAIRGAENGGRVDDLPSHIFTSDDGDLDLKCPTEVGITDRREGELSKLGFLPVCHYKNTDYAVFFGAQTTHKPKTYDRPEATANAAISSRLPYIMASSRFAHYLKVMGRDKVGSYMEAQDCENWLNNWISNYINASDTAGEETRAAFPLRDARVTVEEVPGRPGSYNAIAWLRPWLQMEELTTSLRLVASIPGNSKS